MYRHLFYVTPGVWLTVCNMFVNNVSKTSLTSVYSVLVTTVTVIFKKNDSVTVLKSYMYSVSIKK